MPLYDISVVLSFAADDEDEAEGVLDQFLDKVETDGFDFQTASLEEAAIAE